MKFPICTSSMCLLLENIHEAPYLNNETFESFYLFLCPQLLSQEQISGELSTREHKNN